MEDFINRVANMISNAKKIVIFVGAGLSTESGIPDFRSPGGVWDKYDPEDFYFQNFISDRSKREKYWEMVTEMYDAMKDAKPNAGHRAVAELEKLGKLDCLITQNIDGLHFKAGNSEKKVLELHGTAMHVTCLDCKKRYERGPIQERIAAGEKAPQCQSCGGLLKPATISFGQNMPERETAEAFRHSAECDLFIVIGSSLVVYPAAQMPVVAKQSGAKLVIINRDETACDKRADVIINGQAGTIMAAILDEVKNNLDRKA
ncbi:MAG: sir2 family protein [Deltaproteobacteria bacterium]|nr:sir2 family protein [Deltaproteobacteria bacterium]